MNPETPPPTFAPHLQRGGTGLVEMRRLLEAFGEHGDFKRLRQQTYQENLLGKTSDHMIQAMLRAFKRRFLQAVDLPPALTLSTVMRCPLPEAAKIQTLFPYFICTDALVEQCYRHLVLPRVGSAQASLSRTEVTDYLKELSHPHPEIGRWSAYLQLRWSHGFLALLRHFGLMERAPSTQLQPLWLLPETFAFFWLWFWRATESFHTAAAHMVWTILQVNERYRDDLLAEGQLRGWWRYQRAGGIVDFSPRQTDLEVWLEHGLA